MIHYFLYMNKCSFFIYIYVCSIKHIILLYLIYQHQLFCFYLIHIHYFYLIKIKIIMSYNRRMWNHSIFHIPYKYKDIYSLKNDDLKCLYVVYICLMSFSQICIQKWFFICFLYILKFDSTEVHRYSITGVHVMSYFWCHFGF